MKICNKCKIQKDYTNFFRDKKMKDGFVNTCKSCRKEYKKKHYQYNKKIIRKKHKEYYEANKEKVNEINKKWKEKHPNYMVEYRKKHYKENKKEILLKNKNWCLKNLNYQKERYNNNSLYKLKCVLRSNTYRAFKKNGYKKNGRTEKLLGASFEIASKHLERQFTKGMKWNNHGEWHIDHIIPLASASTEEEVIRLCHYRNLQPLWAKDNLEKQDKIPNVQIQFKL